MIAGLLIALAALEDASATKLARTPLATGTFEVLVYQQSEETYCSVRARGARVDEVVGEIAAQTGRRLRGFDAIAKPEALDADLEGRPVAQVITTLLGATGLRAEVNAGEIDVTRDLGPGAKLGELEELAEVAWLRALRLHGTHEGAAEGELALASIQERRSNFGAARTHYENIARWHPASELVPEALWRAGLALERIEEWTEALRAFSNLANLARPHGYGARARLEIARCYAKKNEGEQGLKMLDALDNLFPYANAEERASRLYVRALALGAAGRAAEALATLEQADVLALDKANTLEATRLRAEALEQVGFPADAARAWLSYSDRCTPARRDEALTRAAKLALDAEDPLAVLFIQRAALGTPAASAIDPLARRAQDALRLDGSRREADSKARIARAAELVGMRSYRQALVLLEPLHRSIDLLAEEERVEIVALYASALDQERGLDDALEVIKGAVRTFEKLEDRKRLYVLAGTLCEAREEWERAVEAYRGQL